MDKERGVLKSVSTPRQVDVAVAWRRKRERGREKELTSSSAGLEKVLCHVALEVLEESDLLVEGVWVGGQGVELFRQIPVDELK